VRSLNYQHQSYVGRQFNDWTVLKISRISDQNETFWFTKCKCGLEKETRATQVARGISKGCTYCRGQAHKNTDSPYWEGGKFVSKQLYTAWKWSAQRRKIEFLVSIEELEALFEKQGGECVFTGVELVFPKNSRESTLGTASPDRIDSNKPYTVDNIQWVHKTINKMKMDMTDRDFKDWCSKVARHGGSCGV